MRDPVAPRVGFYGEDAVSRRLAIRENMISHCSALFYETVRTR